MCQSHSPRLARSACALAIVVGAIIPTSAQAQTNWSAFNDFYVNVPATGGYNQSTWISNAGIITYDTGLTNANAWGYAGGNFNGEGFPSSVGTYVSGGALYSLTAGNTYAGPGVSFDLGGGNFWIGYNDEYGSVGLPNALTQIGKYTLEWFPGSPNYTSNPSGVNNKYLWVQSTGLSPSTDGLGAIVSWTAPYAGTFNFSGSYVNGNYGQTTDFAIVDSTGTTLLAKTNLSASSSVRTYSFSRALSAGQVVQYQVGTPAAAQGSPLGLEANIATAANWNAYRDFYLAPTAAGWTGATTPSPLGAAWGYYDANVNGFGFPSQIGSFFTTQFSGSGSQNLYQFSTNAPLGPGTLVGASGWFATGGAGFAVYSNSTNFPWGTSLGRYDNPWFEGAPPASNRIWLQASQIGNTNAEGIAPVLSWTAPVSGYYTVDGSWVVGNTNAPSSGASLAIADSSGLTYDRYSAATGSSNAFTYTKYYAAGSVIQFQVGSDFKVGAPVGLAADVSGTSSSNTAYFVNTGMSAKESSILTGSGSLTKSGNGTLTLSANNTFSGALSAQAGVLNLNTTGGSAAGSISSLSVASGATLLVSQSNQVNNIASVTLSGGTISRASGVSETFGTLDLTGASTLDFGSGTAGTLTFGTYEGGGTPSAILTLNNFFFGNSLVLGSDLSSYLAPGTYNTTSFANSYLVINSVSGGFMASESGGTFTITAIPEPSTYLAAAGLLAMLIAPVGKRVLRRSKSVD